MSIRGVGKPGGSFPLSQVEDTSSLEKLENLRGANGVQASERARGSALASAAQSSQGAQASPLLRSLEQGEISFQTYAKAHIEEATSNLSGLSAEKLSFIRDALMEELRSNPLFSDLVTKLGGSEALLDPSEEDEG